MRKPTIRVLTKSDTAQPICGFVFAHANCWFSHAVAHSEIDSMNFLNHDNRADVIGTFNSISRYLDGLFNIDDSYFEGMVN